MAALVLALVLALVACASPLTRGVVVDKGHTAPYSWQSWVPIYTTTCQPPPGGCSMTVLMWVPMTHQEPERWYLVVQGDDGRRTDTVTVDHATWDRLRPGDTWVAP